MSGNNEFRETSNHMTGGFEAHSTVVDQQFETRVLTVCKSDCGSCNNIYT